MGRGNKIVIQNTELTKSLTQVTALPPGLCPAPALSSFGLPGFCRPSVRPQPCMVPYRETTLVVFAYRSDNHAAVLRLQKTQPKDRRAYDAPYRNPCRTTARTGGRQGLGTRRLSPGIFICTLYLTVCYFNGKLVNVQTRIIS